MHELLFHRQHALEGEDLRRCATELGLDVGQFDSDRSSEAVLDRIERDFRSGIESGEVRGTPTLFVDGVVHLGGYDVDTLLELVKR
jgi:predicted DsbA family dithiol-disulfide isomerase